MIDAPHLLVAARLDARALESWVSAGWLKPTRGTGGWSFADSDLPRARLINDLQQGLGMNDEGVGAVLDLVDQIHDLEHMLRALLAVARALPAPVQRCISANMTQTAGPDGLIGKPRRVGRPDESGQDASA